MALQYTEEDIRKGLILPDSDFGNKLMFIGDRFHDGSYLWYDKDENTLYLSMLMSKQERRGYVLELLQNARAFGYHMKAVSVSLRMTKILSRFGFKYDIEADMWTFKNPASC